eukprot:Clim_evm22s23 gene=Clim_evmTU22s23
MALNSGILKGKTLFITGASRGIGLSIGLKAAADGANVVIAAKTAEPHPKLPGTIFTAADDIEKAGGKALPIVCDVRDESSVQNAVQAASKEFGGIDILVNNASAISLTPTLQTDMKRYDLMHSVNARGTFLCSRTCIPRLLESEHPHILNISPPLDIDKFWFGAHPAYTLAKYGMTLYAHAMSDEFAEAGININCLWPRTAVATAAMVMLGGGEQAMALCRKPEIMADAAYLILSKTKGTFTGQFVIDDEILKESGITDMEQYSVVKGTTPAPDFFVKYDVNGKRITAPVKLK